MKIWNHHEGYKEAKINVQNQSLDADLKLIDDLFGRDNLNYGMNAGDVKKEALAQLEKEWRSGEVIETKWQTSTLTLPWL